MQLSLEEINGALPGELGGGLAVARWRLREVLDGVELLQRDAQQWSVISNFHMYFSRPGTGSFLYSGQRRDKLVKGEGGFKLCRREVIMDYADIEVPTLALIL